MNAKLPKKDRTNAIILLLAVIAALVLGYYLPKRGAQPAPTLSEQEIERMKQAQREKFADLHAESVDAARQESPVREE